MSLIGQPTECSAPAAVVVTAFDLPSGHRFASHAHVDRHQLVWCSTGALRVTIEARAWLLPPTLALWVPAGTMHATTAASPTAMRGIYLDQAIDPHGWTAPTVVTVTPLARELIEYLAVLEPDCAEHERALAVLFDILRPVTEAVFEVAMPTDPRALTVARALLRDPSDGRSLEQWGDAASASGRTLARLFHAQTGLVFGAWRTLVRIRVALLLLADGVPVSNVARRVGYASASAFVAAFHRTTGQTPGAYFRGENADRTPPSPRRHDRRRSTVAMAARMASEASMR